MGNHNNGFSGGYGFGAPSTTAGRANEYVAGGVGGPHHHHQLTMHRQWYDEPLYANDTDEFYMYGREAGGSVAMGGAGAVGHGRRMMSNSRREQRNGVISLRSAGDISLPQNGHGRRGSGSHKNGQQGRFQGNGDYSGSVSDIQSVTSRMSSVSVSECLINRQIANSQLNSWH